MQVVPCLDASHTHRQEDEYAERWWQAERLPCDGGGSEGVRRCDTGGRTEAVNVCTWVPLSPAAPLKTLVARTCSRGSQRPFFILRL